MLKDFISYISKNKLIRAGGRTLLTVSGGIDSTVMADLFYHAGLTFDLAHVNFKLRENESDRDEQFVRSLAVKYKVRVFVKHVNTKKFARDNKISIQLAARQLRYDWFNEIASKESYDYIATAHHLDDQVETFLINLSRGATGIAGLHGILPAQGRIIRPLMFTDRRQIELYAVENEIDFVEDSSNSSVKYTRNRIRHKIVPQIEKINPSFRQAINDTIENIREVESIYRQAVEEKKSEFLVVKGERIYISSERFFSLQPLETWAYELLSPYGFNHSNIIDIAGMKDAIPGKEILSATHRLIRDRDNLVISPREISGGEITYQVSAKDLSQGIVKYPVHLGLKILDEMPVEFDASGCSACLDLDELKFPLLIRKWRQGDFFYPIGMSKRKKLSDFFIDQKLMMMDKEQQWLLCSGENIVWVIGRRIDNRFKITSSTKRILNVILYPESELPGNVI